MTPAVQAAAHSVRTGDLHVLVTGIDEQPAAVGAGRRADDLAVLGAPRRLADLFRSGQRGSFERPVRNESGGASRRRCLRARGDGQHDRDERNRDCENASLKH